VEAPAVHADAEALAALVARLGQEIARDHPEGVVLVGVLKGALPFLADLCRAIPGIPVAVDFLALTRFAPDTGRVRLLHDVEIDVAGRDVVLVDDVVDTGLTLAYLAGVLAARGARQVDACVLFDRAGLRIVPHPVRYRGLEVGEEFLLGYGLAFRERYRNLPAVYRADRRAVSADPDACVEALYAPGGRPGVGGNVPSG